MLNSALYCFTKLHPKKVCIYIYFQQAAQKRPLKRREWEKGKKKLKAFFSWNVKVKIHVLYILHEECVLVPLTCIIALRTLTLGLNAVYKSFYELNTLIQSNSFSFHFAIIETHKFLMLGNLA